MAELADESVCQNGGILGINHLYSLCLRAVGLRDVNRQTEVVAVVFKIGLLSVHYDLLRHCRRHELQSVLAVCRHSAVLPFTCSYTYTQCAFG